MKQDVDFSGQRDVHVHLYGCLTPEDIADEINQLQSAGRPQAKELHDRLSWYLASRRELTGVTPNLEKILNGDVEVIRAAYLVLQPCDFPTFQARFNLAIAVFPLRADRLSAIDRVFARLAAEGVLDVELRLPLPPALDTSSKLQLLRALTARFAAAQKRLVVTLPRPQLTEAYELFKELLRECDHSEVVSGIDLCGDEEPYPAHSYRDFFLEVRRDFGTSLDILPHVGETYRTLSLASAARRVAEMAHLGVTRLGHATALGLAPEALAGLPLVEEKSETDYHKQWLKDHAAELKRFGYVPPRAWPRASTYTPAVIAATQELQNALLPWVAETSVPIECCPTSNLRLGQIGQAAHPIRRFVDHNIHCFVCSDDPGIFASPLKREQELAAAWLEQEPPSD